MNGKQLKNSILQWAIQGKLVPQDPNDEPASVLLERIRAEKARLVKEGKIKKDKNESIIFRGDDNSHYEKFANGTVKCIDDEIPFEIPQSWCWVRLNELGYYRKGPFGSSLTKDMFIPYSNSAVKVYEQKNAIQKDYRLGHYYISDAKFNQMQSFVTNPGDIIVSCAGTIGETYQLPDNAPIGIINQALMRVCLYDKSISEYWQMSFDFILLVNSEMKGAGSAIKNIPPFEVLKSLLAPIPPIAEQNRILSQYRILQNKIRTFETLNCDLERLNSTIFDKLKKSVLKEAIQGKLVPQSPDDEPATELLERIKAEKAKLFKEGKLKKKDITDSVIFKGDDNKYYERVNGNLLDISDEVPFDLPESWAWARLSTVCNMFTGNSISEKDKSTYFTGVSGMQYIGTKDVRFDNSIDYKNGIAIPDMFLPNFKIAPAGSVLMCIEGGSAGRKFGQTDRDVCFGNKLCCFSSFGCYQRYLYYYIQSPSFFESFQKNKTGIIGGVSVNSLKNLLIAIPPLKEQVRIAQHVAETLSSL